jgi:L-aminopeptidase/D-esterase-like protein
MSIRSLPSSLALSVGHSTDDRLRSGVTVILPDERAIAAVHVAGGAPGTHETDLLAPECTVERVDAVVLSGGSAFGLAAADGVMAWLAARGRGFAVGDVRVPIVPAAILFDLRNGGNKQTIASPSAGAIRSPYFDLGLAACDAADRNVALGSVGAGTGATIANLKGGFGAASADLSGGHTIVAFVAVNALGRVTWGDGPHFRAAPFERAGEFGGLGIPDPLPDDAAVPVTKPSAAALANTTIAVLATDLPLSKAQAKRLAMAGHDGLALAIYPAHTAFDGDVIFALSTAADGAPASLEALEEVSALAPSTLARAVAKAVYEASPAEGDAMPAWRSRFGGFS